MNGVVTEIKPRGYLAEMDSDVSMLAPGTVFETYRVVDGSEVVVGRGVFQKTMRDGILKIKPDPQSGLSFGDPQVGDLVRSV